MAKKLVNEALVKKALNIDSFRNLSKDKVIEFVSLIPDMDKEVALSIINQFPSFAQTSQVMISHLKDVCQSAIASNDASQKQVVESYNQVLDALSTVYQREDLTSEERMSISYQMIDIADKINAKDTENKCFLLTAIKWVAGSFFSGLAIGGTILGISSWMKHNPKAI